METTQCIHEDVATVLVTNTVADRVSTKVIELHEALNKPTIPVFKKLLETEAIVNTGISEEDISNSQSLLDPFKIRALGKIARSDHNTSQGPGAAAVGERIYADIIYDVNANSYLITMDCFSGFGMLVWIVNKATTTIMSALDQVISEYHLGSGDYAVHS